MNRREFLRGLSAGSLLVLSGLSFARVKEEEVAFSYEVTLPYRKDVKLWLPLPADTDYQRLVSLSFEGSYRRAGTYRDPVFGAPTLYAEFSGNVGDKRIFVKMRVRFRPRRVSLIEGSHPIPSDVRKFLEPSEHIPTTGKVAEIAGRITEGKRTPIYKAWAIYEWVVENTYRDPKVKGCGPGDVNSMLEILERGGKIGGKCADHSSIFVALCRAAGIPAREIFGLRVLPAKLSETLSIKKGAKDLTKAQHCRAEFWAGEWIPVDPADVTKIRLKEKLKPGHPRLEFAKRYLFGNWDHHWIAYNWARDFVLEPRQNFVPLNFFGYPYAEVEGEPLNWLEPDSFVYRIRKLS